MNEKRRIRPVPRWLNRIHTRDVLAQIDECSKTFWAAEVAEQALTEAQHRKALGLPEVTRQ